MIDQLIADAAIANGESLSAGINLQGGRLVGILMPGTWTAADLTFQSSLDGSTFADLYDDEGNEVTVVADASQFIVPLAPAKFLGARYLKVRSGTSGTPVNQGGARTIQLVMID